jgi:hypothetical protein
LARVLDVPRNSEILLHQVLSFTHSCFERQGAAFIPPETIEAPFNAIYTPRFTFTGRVLGYDAGGDVVFSRDFTGVSESRFAFQGVIPPFAEREGFFLTDTSSTSSQLIQCRSRPRCAGEREQAPTFRAGRAS